MQRYSNPNFEKMCNPHLDSYTNQWKRSLLQRKISLFQLPSQCYENSEILSVETVLSEDLSTKTD